MAKTSEYKVDRDLRLAARFYFYSNLMGLKSKNCYPLLIQEFNISEATVIDLLSQNSDTITKLINNNITILQLSKVYPFMSWHYHHTKRLKMKQLQLLALF